MTRKRRTIRAIRGKEATLALIGLLLLVRAPRLLAAGANNLAVRTLAREWPPIRPEAGPPRCERRLDVSAAAPTLALARRLDRNQQRVLLNRGRAAWLQGDCSGAREAWARAMAAAPGDRIAAFWLSLATFSKTGSSPPDLSADQEMAQYADTLGQQAGALDREAALSWYRFSLALSPGRQAAERLAARYRAMGKAQEALDVWRWLAAVRPPEDADHWWALGQAAELERDWRQAAQVYGQGGKTAAEPYGLWIRQAAMFVRLGQVHEQEQAYHHAIEACPDCVAPYLSLGHLWRDQGQLQGALDWYREAARVAPGDPNPPYYQAQTLYERGEQAPATAALAQAVDLHRGKPWQWAAQLGDWRQEQGDRQGALAAYHQALEWKPGDEAMEERISELQALPSRGPTDGQ